MDMDYPSSVKIELDPSTHWVLAMAYHGIPRLAAWVRITKRCICFC